MKGRIIILLAAAFLAAAAIFTMAEAEPVRDPIPMIEALFNESPRLVSFSLHRLSSSGKELVEAIHLACPGGECSEEVECLMESCVYTKVVGTEIKYGMSFAPKERLLEGDYLFRVEGADSLSNKKNSTHIFIVDYMELEIEIAEPKHGGTTATKADVVITTSRDGRPADAECRHNPVTKMFSVMEDFDETGGSRHKISGVDVPFKTNVLCMDELTGKIFPSDGNPFALEIARDTTKPIVTQARIAPEGIYEGQGPFFFNVTIVTDDRTVCRFSKESTSYEEMEDLSPDMDVFSRENRKDMIAVLTDDADVTYNVVCNNSVGMLSDPYQFVLSVHTSAPARISLIRPAKSYLSDERFTIEARTSKDANCMFRNSSGGVIYDGTLIAPSKTHIKTGVWLVEGSHKIEMLCYWGGTEPAKAEFTIRVDRTRPEKPVVDDSSGLEGNEGYTPNLDRLRASISSYDAGSGIEGFNYSIVNASSGRVIYEGTAEAGDCDDGRCAARVVADGLRLSNMTRFYFSAVAIDRAGLVSEAGESDGIIADTSRKPMDTAKPEGYIEKDNTESGVKVTLKCRDLGAVKSGCDESSFSYDSSEDEDGCSPNKEYEGSVMFNEDGWFCFEVSDFSGNVDTGSEKITIPEERADDSDGDGVRDALDNCPDAANRGQEDLDGDNVGDVCDVCIGTPNPGQADTDRDGLGDDCDDCPASRPGARVDDTGCESEDPYEPPDPVERDSDGDGMRNSWEIEHGLDPNDPNDAMLDNDGDGLTNIEEYDIGTDPNNDDSDGDGRSDSEEVSKGSSPTDAESAPSGGGFGIWLLIIGIVVVLGGIGYLLYLEYQKKNQKRPPPFLMRPRPAMGRPPIHGMKPGAPRPTHGLQPPQGLGQRPGIMPGKMPGPAAPLTPQQRADAQKRMQERAIERRQAIAGAVNAQQKPDPKAQVLPQKNDKAQAATGKAAAGTTEKAIEGAGVDNKPGEVRVNKGPAEKPAKAAAAATAKKRKKAAEKDSMERLEAMVGKLRRKIDSMQEHESAKKPTRDLIDQVKSLKEQVPKRSNEELISKVDKIVREGEKKAGK